MRAFVTGGTGHVGGNLVRELLKQDYEVRCLVRSDTRAIDGLKIETVKGNMLNPTEMKKLMNDCDVMFHSAAFVAVEKINEELMWKINVEGTKSVCEAALDSDIEKMIHFSSIHAFNQKPTNQPLTEERPLVTDKRAPPYDRTKAEAQRIVNQTIENGLDCNILHPTGIIGPHDYKLSRMGEVIKSMANGKMPVTLRTGFNWVDVRDVSKSAINCIDKGLIGQHYILPGEWSSMKNISSIISEKTGKRTSLITLPFWTSYMALPFATVKSKITGKRPSFSRGALQALATQCKEIPGELAKKHLDHSPRPIQESIEDTLEWFESQK
mgnify:CR=1 FL=1|tara:strand:- start:83732 stop:84706 length:975 start_codon:yes stop_codon:yes gene_type:complete